MSDPYLGSKIRVISKAEIRYEGILYNVDKETTTVSLIQVQAYGTEGRKGGVDELPASQEIYPSIAFKAADIKDLVVLETPSTGEQEPQTQQPAPPPETADLSYGFPKGAAPYGAPGYYPNQHDLYAQFYQQYAAYAQHYYQQYGPFMGMPGPFAPNSQTDQFEPQDGKSSLPQPPMPFLPPPPHLIPNQHYQNSPQPQSQLQGMPSIIAETQQTSNSTPPVLASPAANVQAAEEEIAVPLGPESVESVWGPLYPKSQPSASTALGQQSRPEMEKDKKVPGFSQRAEDAIAILSSSKAGSKKGAKDGNVTTGKVGDLIQKGHVDAQRSNTSGAGRDGWPAENGKTVEIDTATENADNGGQATPTGAPPKRPSQSRDNYRRGGQRGRGGGYGYGYDSDNPSGRGNGGHRSGYGKGQGGMPANQRLVFSGDYDFISANEQFHKEDIVKELQRMKLGDQEAAPSESSPADDQSAVTDTPQTGETANVEPPVPTNEELGLVETAYDSKKSFFDNLSSGASESDTHRNSGFGGVRRKQNSETFGASGISYGRERGRGFGGYRRGRGGYRRSNDQYDSFDNNRQRDRW